MGDIGRQDSMYCTFLIRSRWAQEAVGKDKVGADFGDDPKQPKDVAAGQKCGELR